MGTSYLGFHAQTVCSHHTSVKHGHNLVDDISGRVIIGSKLPEDLDEVEWLDITCWSVVDFFHPQFLPSSFES